MAKSKVEEIEKWKTAMGMDGLFICGGL